MAIQLYISRKSVKKQCSTPRVSDSVFLAPKTLKNRLMVILIALWFINQTHNEIAFHDHYDNYYKKDRF